MDLCGVAMVTRDGTVVTELAAGPADTAAGTPCTLATRFQLCSVSKHFTAAAVLLLAESGRLALDDTVDHWLPGGPPQWSGVTLHHLLSHTAGVPHWLEAADLDPAAPMNIGERLCISAMTGRLRTFEGRAPRGRVFVVKQHSTLRTLAAWRAGRGIWTPANYGYIALFVLGALAIVTTWLGFAMDRSGSSPAQVPVPPILSVSFAPGSTPPASMSVYTFLEEAPAPVKLIVTATGEFTGHQSSASWTLDIQGFTGYLCPGQAPLRMVPFTQQGKNDYYIGGSSPVSPIGGSPFLVVKLCWDRGAPLIASGSYLSAALSPVLASGGPSGTLTRSLVLSGSSLSSYALAGGIPPTEESAQAWIWNSSLSGEVQDQARYEIPIIASSLPGIQHDNKNAFYSGILFGIAGGAAVSLIPALLDAVDRRKSRNQPAAVAETPSRPPHQPRYIRTAGRQPNRSPQRRRR
jgi:hypothetical protein